MGDDPVRPAPRPALHYGFFKRLKTASVSAVITSLLWAVYIAVYWPRGEPREAAFAQANPVETMQAGDQAILSPRPTPSETEVPQPIYIPPREGLRMPVEGVLTNQLADTYSQTREDGMRGHDAIDILAPRGTPVVAAAAGTLVKLFLSEDGGNAVYERSPDGKSIYYYAHLDSYAPGLAEGVAVIPGQVLGFVGSTGNADPAAPHLHFAITVLAPGDQWWQGRPVNPYPVLGGR